MLSRRNFLLLILLLLGLDFGVGWLLRPAAPAGWKIERWEAGFGSWGSGGFGVAYDIAMPADYDFAQKCGVAWIGGDEDSPEDFRIKLTFAPTADAQQSEFAEFLKSDAADAARNFGRSATDIEIGAPAPLAIGPLRFVRRGLTLANARLGAGPQTATARGFTLAGEKLAIVADLQGEPTASISDNIVGSLSRARGVGLLDLLMGAIPGLNGC